MNKIDYKFKQQYADLRIAIGWAEAPDLNHDEKARLSEARNNLELLNTAEFIKLVKFAVEASIPIKAPLPR